MDPGLSWNCARGLPGSVNPIRAKRRASSSSSKLNDSSAVSLRRPVRGKDLPFPRRPALGCHFEPHFFARIRLAIQFLRLRGRPADLAYTQHYNLEITAVVGYPQPVSNPHFTGSLGSLSIRQNSSQIARLLRQRPGLEEPRRPQPCVHAYTSHGSILSGNCGVFVPPDLSGSCPSSCCGPVP